MGKFESACRKCGHPTDNIADIPPIGDQPGLRAFLCDNCGAVDSVLIEPNGREAYRGDGEGGVRIMPSGDSRWYWEVIKDDRTVVARGVADTEPAACEQASEATRKAKLNA